MGLHCVLARSGYISNNRNFKQQGIMVYWIIGVIWGGFMMSGMFVGIILIGEQINKQIKKRNRL
jgi:hypothetical protein